MTIARAVLPPILAAALTGACGDTAPSPGDGSSTAAPADCATAEGPSRWTPGPAGLSLTDRYGDAEGEALGAVAGVASNGRVVALFDAAAPSLVVLDRRFGVLWRNERRGRGPGELQPYPLASPPGSYQQWLDAEGDTLAVFDGARVTLFGVDGSIRRGPTLATPGLTGYSSRMELLDGALVYPRSGYDFMSSYEPASPRLRLVSSRDPERSLLEVELAPLPTRDGVPWLSADQAAPLWVVRGRCIYAVDGEEPRLLVSVVGSDRVDTIPFELPAVHRTAARQVFEREQAEALRLPPGRIPEPTAMKRMDALRVDPDGWVWIRPYQDPRPGGMVVVRVRVPSGSTEVSTLPTFPVAFGATGELYALRFSALHEAVLERWEVRSDSAAAEG